GQPVRVPHHHRFDVVSSDPQQRLQRASAVGGSLVQHLDPKRQLVTQAAAKGRRQVGHLVVGGSATPQPPVHLTAVVGRLAPARHQRLPPVDVQVAIAVSPPSATTTRSSALPRSTAARTIGTLPLSSPRRRTKDRSIFSSRTGNRCR